MVIKNKNVTDSSKRIIVIILMFTLFYVKSDHKKNPELIYILLWENRNMPPFIHMKSKRKSFTYMNCEFQNCYITDQKGYFNDMTDYDAILFNSIDIKDGYSELPELRSDNQLYVFVSTESPPMYPMYDYLNWYFNYTWTYRMDSDIIYPYFVARHRDGKVVAPKQEVHWMDSKEMKPTSQDIKDKLQKKKIAAAWFVTNCLAISNRFNYVRNLREALTTYNLEVDIYGVCGNSYCPGDLMDECLAKVESDYYFYLSFENSFSEDYVTEKLMTALDHYAIPVVLGGANYTRFERYFFVTWQFSWKKGVSYYDCFSGRPKIAITVLLKIVYLYNLLLNRKP